MPFLIILAVFLFLLSLITAVWINLQTRQQTGYKDGITSPDKELDVGALSENPTLAYDILLEKKEFDVSTIDSMLHMLKPEHRPRIKVISRDLRITLPTKVYINQPFDLKVSIAQEGGDLPPAPPHERQVSSPGDKLWFLAHDEKPPIQVELQFAKEEFSANTTKQLKALKKDNLTEFRFCVKPLKAEACCLTIIISYDPKKAGSEQIEEASEQVEKVTVDKTNWSDDDPKKQEHSEEVTKKSTISAVSAPLVVKTESVTVEVKSLFGLNTTELKFFKGAVGAVINLGVIVYLAATKQANGASAIAVAISVIGGIFTIPISDAVTKLIDSIGQKKQGG